MACAKFYVVLLFAALVQTKVNSGGKINDDRESKVVGGISVTSTTIYRYVVGLYMTDEFIRCMGSLLTYEKVLTACHCLIAPGGIPGRLTLLDQKEQSEKITIVGGLPIQLPRGMVDPYSLPGYKMRGVDIQERTAFALVPHDGCSQAHWLWKNDLAVINVNRAFISVLTPEGNIYPTGIALAPFFSRHLETAREKYKDLRDANRSCSVAGWGSLRLYVPNTSNVTGTLQEVDQTIVPLDVCKRGFCIGQWQQICKQVRLVPQKLNLICAYRADGQYGGPCFGDAGTALVCRNSEVDPLGQDTFRGFTIGVLSASLHCGVIFGGPFFYTPLVEYWSFLRAHDGRFESSRWTLEPKKPCKLIGPPGIRQCAPGTGDVPLDPEAKTSKSPPSFPNTLRVVHCALIVVVVSRSQINSSH